MECRFSSKACARKIRRPIMCCRSKISGNVAKLCIAPVCDVTIQCIANWFHLLTRISGESTTHHLKCAWLFLLTYKCSEEKEPAFCRRQGYKMDNFSPRGKVSAPVSKRRTKGQWQVQVEEFCWDKHKKSRLKEDTEEPSSWAFGLGIRGNWSIEKVCGSQKGGKKYKKRKTVLVTCIW